MKGLLVALLLAFGPGDVVPEELVKGDRYESFFYAREIPDDIFDLMQGRSYKEGCTVPRNSLRYLRLLHRDIDGRAKVGEMVVAASIADDVLDIFRQLFKASYPIESVLLVDRFGADDERSMLANNSSSFNFRIAPHSGKISKHSTGEAVDINPLYNPYYKVKPDGRTIVDPKAARRYVDRNAKFPYKIEKGDICHRLFLAHGFKWGGGWASTKDWQHFEK